MKAALIQVGKTTNRDFENIIDDYVHRVKHYISFEVITIPELRNTKSMTQDEQKRKEGELILKQIADGDHVVLLDEHGKEMRSIELAEWMGRKMQTVSKRLVFIIGGPYGFSNDVYKAAAEKLSLSKLTFSHQMIRMLFTEQLYRAMTILRGENYHHE